MNRTHALLAVALLLAGIATVVPAQSGGCTEAGRLHPQPLDPPAPVSGSVAYTCAALTVRGLWTVGSEGRLTLDDVLVDFVPDESGTAGLVVDGRLATLGGTVLRAAGGLFRIDARPGSTLAMADSLVAGADRFTVETDDAVLDRLRIADAVDTGLLLRGDARLEDVTVDGAVTGVRVEQAARPSLNGLSTSRIAATGVQAMGGSQPTARSCSIQGADSAVRLRDASTLSLEGCTLSGPAQARLESTSAGSPRLVLLDTPAELPLLVRDAGSRIDLRWSVAVRGQPVGAFSLAGGQLTGRDASGNGIPAQTLDANGRSPVFVLDDRSIVGTSIDDHNPWSFLVRKGSSLGAAEVEVRSSRVLDPVVVPVTFDDDGAAPVWANPATALRQTQPAGAAGWSATGAVGLAWEAADDTVDGLHPNRGVDRYEVLQEAPGATTLLHRTNATSLALDDLASGSHSFKVRAVDFAGNPSAYTPAMQVVVDESGPRVSMSSNRTPVRSITQQGSVTHYFARPFKVEANATDPQSGPLAVAYRIGPSGPYQPYAAALQFVQEGSYEVSLRAANTAGAQAFANQTFVLDLRPPTLQVQVTPPLPDGGSGWYRGPIRLTAAAQDLGEAGVDNVTYRMGTSAAAPVGAGAVLDFNGEGTLRVNATDRSGNLATSQVVLRRDNVTPDLRVTLDGTLGQGGWYVSPVRMSVEASDDHSGLAAVTRRLGDSPAVETAQQVTFATSGAQHYTLRATDRAGNAREVSVNLTLDADAPVPPVARFTAADGGSVAWDWSHGPPIDLVSGLGAVDLQRGDADGAVLQSIPLAASGASGTTGQFPSGTQYLRIRVSDQAGNTATSPWQKLTVEGGLPSDPAAAVTRVRGTAHVSFLPPAGFDVAEVRLLVEGRLHDARSEAPYEFAVPTRDLEDGKAELRFVALSTSGAQYEESRFLDVRNGYLAAFVDQPLPSLLAGGASLAAVALCGAAFVLGRRWVLL